MPVDYKFALARLEYSCTDYDKEAFLKEAIASGQEIYTKEIETNKNLLNTIEIAFSNPNKSSKRSSWLEVKVKDGPDTNDSVSQIHFSTDDRNAKSEAIMLQSIEALYSQYGKQHIISWLHGNKNKKLISVGCAQDELSKEELTAIAREIESKYKP